jgi:WD40 repeat protein
MEAALSDDVLVIAGACSGKNIENNVESIQMWNLKGPQESTTLTGRKKDQALTRIAISPDSKRVVVEAKDYATMWDLTKRANNPENNPKELPHPEAPSIDLLAFSSNGRWLYGFAQDKNPLSPPAGTPIVSRNVWIWELPSGTLRPFQDANREQIAYQNEVFSPDGRWVFLFNRSKSIIVLDLTQSNPTNSPLILVGHDSEVNSGDVQPASRAAVTRSDEDGTIRLWDLTTSAPIASPVTLSGWGGLDSHLSQDRRWLLTRPDNDVATRLWDLTSRVLAPRVLPILPGDDRPMTFEVSNNGRWLVTARTGAARLWDLNSPTLPPRPLGDDKADPKQPMTVAFTNDSRWLVTTQGEATRLWKLDFGNNPVNLGAVKPYFSRDGHWLVTISSNANAARLWDLTLPTPAFRPLPGDDKTDPKQQVIVTFSDDSRWMLTTQREAARLWNLASDPAAEPVSFVGYNHFFSPKSNWLVTISRNDNTAQYWQLTPNGATPHPLPRYKTDTKELTTTRIFPFARFSSDDHWLAFWDGNTAQLWDLTSPVPVPRPLPMDDQPGPVSMTFNNDGRWLLLMHGRAAWLWNLNRGQAGASPVRLSSNDLLGFSFSPDGQWLFTATNSGGGHLYPLRGGRSAGDIPLPGFAGQFGEATFSEDARWLAVGGGKPYWCELPRGKGTMVSDPIYLPPGNNVIVRNLEFSANGRWIIGHGYGGSGASRETRTLLWSTRLREDLIPLACRTAGRNLTSAEWSTFLPGEPYHQTCPEFPPGKGVQQDYKSDSAGSRAALR